jgi:hypothetical protein
MTPPTRPVRPALPLLGPALLVLLGSAVFAAPPDYDREPINYSTAEADNAVTRLQKQLSSGEMKLTHEDDHGYLRSVLKALDVPESSQVLVFSRTSLQRDRIGPKTPRAVYFNDDVYVGFCLRGEVLEVSAADHTIGTAFYTLDQEPAGRPRFARHTDSCLICHGSSLTRNTPGHLVRSVFPGPTGDPILSAGTYRTDHTSPFEKRWGGWYVTGTHGSMAHMGNLVVRNRQEADDGPDNAAGQNVTDLRARFTVANYLTPHSDLVALMVLAHQADVHNRLARAGLETRTALHYQAELNRALKGPPTNTFDSVTSRIKAVGDELLKGLLFCDEAPLTDRVAGTSDFEQEFAARGPFDRQGRSLRQFDLATRLFKYPCSYLVYSEAFAKLPANVKDYVLRRMYDVLTGRDADKAFAHLTAVDRAAVLEILRDTLPGLPQYWK